MKFTKNNFLPYRTRFYESYSGALCNIEGFIPKMPRTYKIEKPFNFPGSVEVQLKRDWMSDSIVNGITEPE